VGIILLLPALASPDRSNRKKQEPIVMEFAHLHLHTEYPRCWTVWAFQGVRGASARSGIKHICPPITASAYGAMEWYKTATAAGIHPIASELRRIWAEGSAWLASVKVSPPVLAENETGATY